MPPLLCFLHFLMQNHLAIALLSGGLDSTLAAAIMARQPGISVIGYHFRHPFAPAVGEDGLLPAERGAYQVGIPIIVEADDTAFIEMVKSPRYGTGTGANPCKDCRLFVLKRAAKMLQLIGGEFVITGEVVGQRPMSQNSGAIELIERESGLAGRILRPLCAKKLPPTLPEEKDWISRGNLYDFYGRNRKPQMALAERLGISDYPSPAGGCLLTEKAFAARFRDLIKHNSAAGPLQVESLKIGRHFRLPDELKVIIARNEDECKWIEKKLSGIYWLMEAADFSGPMAALDREPNDDAVIRVGAIVASYGKGRKLSQIEVNITSPDGKKKKFTVEPAACREYMIGD